MREQQVTLTYDKSRKQLKWTGFGLAFYPVEIGWSTRDGRFVIVDTDPYGDRQKGLNPPLDKWLIHAPRNGAHGKSAPYCDWAMMLVHEARITTS